MYITAIILGVLGLAAAVAAIIAGTRSKEDRSTSEARTILDERLASGEIDPVEHEERLAVLERHEAPSSTQRPWALVAGIVAVVLLIGVLVLLMASAGPGGGWGPQRGGPMGGHMPGMMGGGATTESAAPDVAADADELTVEAGDLYFSPEEIEITAGETVNLVLDNQGDAFHDLDIDGIDFRLAADPGTTDTGALTIDEPGTYTFSCTVPGHASAGMEGTITVVAP